MQVQQSTAHFNVAGVKIEPDSSFAKAENKNGKVTVSAARALNANEQKSTLEQRKALAQKRAMQIVSRAFKDESGLDDTLSRLQDDTGKLRRSVNEKKASIAESSDMIASLQSKYGVDPDSEEQLQLEKLAFGLSRGSITSEDLKDLNLSDYQQHALSFAGKNQVDGMEMSQDEYAMQATIDGIKQIRLERLKSDPIGEALEAADDIMDAANRDAISSLVKDAKDHIDEEAKEKKEAAQKTAEEKKEEKEKEAQRLEKQAEQEEFIERVQEASDQLQSGSDIKRALARQKRSDGENTVLVEQTVDGEAMSSQIESSAAEANSEITNVLNKLSLISDDIKGVALDQKI